VNDKEETKNKPVLCECKNQYKLGISAIKFNFTQSESFSERRERKKNTRKRKERSLLKKYYNTKPDMFMNEFMTQKSA
jgi:hypothetical protein